MVPILKNNSLGLIRELHLANPIERKEKGVKIKVKSVSHHKIDLPCRV